MSDRRNSKVPLFDREVGEDYLAEGTGRVAARKQNLETGTRSILIFTIGREWLALPTEVFQEVVDEGVVRPLPHRRGEVLSGVTNVRGDLLLCVSLSVVLGLDKDARGSRERSSDGRLLICNRNGDRLAFRADDVYGVHRYDPKDLREIPVTLAKAPGATYIVGILPWANRTVGCLDDHRLFEALNRGLG